MKTPILIIGFNRPRNLKKLSKAIDMSDSRRIYISIDGPRDISDADKVNQVRDVVKNFVRENSKAQIRHRFSELNLGCKNGVSSAIDWAFKNEGSLIILEDDVVVSDEFFRYMDFFLKYFELDSRIWHINGFSPLLPPYINKTSYLTSFAHVWGWATWKDRWDKYDRELAYFSPNLLSLTPTLQNKPLSREAMTFFERNLMACKKGFDTWDFQWQFTMWLNGGLAVSPGERLSGNAGFGPAASHTKFAGFWGLNLHPRRGISSNYRNRKIMDRSGLLEDLHEAIVFGIKPQDTEINFTFTTKILIFSRTFPKWIQLKLKRAFAR